MAKPIKTTPILTGIDTVDFFKLKPVNKKCAKCGVNLTPEHAKHYGHCIGCINSLLKH